MVGDPRVYPAFMDAPTPAETALSLLFKKLHPLLEDAAHLDQRGAPALEWEKLHARLVRARHQTVEILEAESERASEGLAELLDTLAANLTPMGESLQQSLILTQLCLEEAPKDLLQHAPAGCVAGAAWGPRMIGFLQKLEDPAFQAKERWKGVDPDLGESEAE